jgi:hypothetical protein
LQAGCRTEELQYPFDSGDVIAQWVAKEHHAVCIERDSRDVSAWVQRLKDARSPSD